MTEMTRCDSSARSRRTAPHAIEVWFRLGAAPRGVDADIDETHALAEMSAPDPCRSRRCEHGRVNARGVVVGMLGCLALAGCGESTGSASHAEPFALPVGPTAWDVSAPAWFHDGTLHVGKRTVELGQRVDQFVLGATGVYWMRGEALMFTNAEGSTQKVEDVGWGNLAVSADRSVFATVDQSRGPTDQYGTHVMQVAAFDTLSGEQLYRTPDEEPDDGDDLADLYSEIMPLLHGVSNERLFFDGATIDLDDASTVPASRDSDGIDVYEGYAETLFPDGYHVSVRGQGRHRELAESSMFAVGRTGARSSTCPSGPPRRSCTTRRPADRPRSMPPGTTSPWSGGATTTRSPVWRSASTSSTSSTSCAHGRSLPASCRPGPARRSAQ